MQGNKLYVGNLKYSATNDDLKGLFTNYGRVVNVNILEGRGFGFVEMSSVDEAERAREALDGQDFQGRILRINEARPPGKDKARRRNVRRF
jgi:RNA recognition motif-containing protein